MASFLARVSRSASRSGWRVTPSREKIASRTLSSTLSWSNSFTSRNLRAIPARIRAPTDNAVISARSTAICPPSGRSSPLSRLTSVVLPAPFDPTSEMSSSGSTRKSTPLTARVSPNDFRRPCASNSDISAAPGSAMDDPAQRADNALRHDQHQGHQDDPQQHLPVLRSLDDIGLQVVVRDPAQDGAAEALEPTQHGHKHNLSGEGPVQNVRRGQTVQRGEQRAGHTGEGTGDDEGGPAVPPDFDADKLGADLVIADRLQRLPKRRCGDHPQRHHADEEDRQHVIVVGEREKPHLVVWDPYQPQEQRGGGDAQPVGPIG